MLPIRCLKATQTLLAVITLVPVLVLTANSGLSECFGFKETTSQSAVTGQMVLSF